MSKLKIALLCNNKMAAPALQRMMQSGVLCGIATTDNDAEVCNIFRELAAVNKVPYSKIARKEYAVQLIEWLKELNADVVFVMTFPWRLPASVLVMPRLGFLNFHYGLLPEMRGADPIFEAIRQRIPVAGVIVHVMDDGLDTGPIVLRREFALQPGVTYGMLSSQMAVLGESMCGEVIDLMKPGDAFPITSQNETNAKYWPKVSEREITIDWQGMDSAAIMALVWACNPVAKGVPTTINGWKIGVVDVTEVNLEGDASSILPGTIVVADAQNGLIVYCRDGKGLKLEVVHTAEGTFAGYKLGFFGIGQGMIFNR